MSNPNELEDKLIDAVIDQIKSDIANGDETAIIELLWSTPVKNLIAYLPEENQKEYKPLTIINKF